MAQPKTIYTCVKCDAQSPKWQGMCTECGSYGTMQVEAGEAKPGAATSVARSLAKPVALTPFEAVGTLAEKRLATGLTELDRVFGGGLVPGSVTLLGGEPGVGKSTVALMVCARLAARGLKTLYVSGEESATQVKMRADRLGLPQKHLFFLGETDADAVVATLEKERPALVVVDSVQMLRSAEVPADAGTVSQVRTGAGKLVAAAKSTDVPVILIGHVTKDGTVAGPKTLEHIVDTVLSFEGERGYPVRLLRALKNRFGSTDETGIFEMNEGGLIEIGNPSGYLLEEREPGVPGGAVTCVMEGSRPLLVEIQALVRKSTFGYPTRKSSGFDLSRLEMLLAVLAKRGGLDLSGHDVFVNVVGGLKLDEPAPDLAVVLALASAFHDRPLPPGLVAWGEVGLAGEIRPCPAPDRRLAEAATLGLTAALAAWPKRLAHKTAGVIPAKGSVIPAKAGIHLTEVRALGAALKEAFR
jgi:DNA repair protein RadA/Sms